jgi:hypothetical protein
VDQARELVSQMEDNARDPEPDDAHAAYTGGWENLQRTCAPVVIAGPGELADRAESLKSLLGGMADECDSWYAARRNGSARSSRASKFSTAQQTAYDARAAFVSAARQHAYAAPGKPAD